jgi:Protein of unknown function (DUF3098)
MSKQQKKGTPQPAKKPGSSHPPFLFKKENYFIMLVGLLVFIIGLLLMVGGGSKDPNQFYPSKIYSFRRITLAPIVIILGLLIEFFAILKKPKADQNS